MSTKNTYALSIGISNYRHLRRLSCPARDAQDLAEVVSRAAGPAQVRLLLDGEATKPAILRDLAWLADSAGPEDTVVVFFSGHGGRAGTHEEEAACFCPAEASSNALVETSITGCDLTAALRAVHSERLIVLIDSCHSGGFGEPRSGSTGLTAELTAKDVSSLLQGRGRVIMAASRPDEAAWELEGMRNGLFTHYLLRGLRGEVAREDGTIWVSELFGYVSRSVRQHGLQHPYQKAVGEDFVVAVWAGAANPEAPASRPALQEIDQRSLRRMMREAYNRPELSLLCRDLGLSIEDLPGATLETQLMELIDHCHRHSLQKRLLDMVRADRPQLTAAG